MKISKYAKWIDIGENKYALFNSILMQIIFIEKEKIDEIINFKTVHKETELLRNYGIYVDDDIILDEIFNNLKQGIISQSKQLSIMYLNITTHCNLACKYCFIDNNPISKNRCSDMKFETASIAIDKFINEIRTNEVEEPQIIIYGGEPIINFIVLKQIVNYIRKQEKNLTLTIITNGTMLREKEIEFFKKNKVGIGISLDGPKEINDKNRVFKIGNKSVYDSAITGINLLNNADYQYCVSSTVTPNVVENEENIINWIKKANIKNVFWNLYHYSDKSDDWELFYDKMSDFILSIYDKLDDINVEEERVKEQLKLFLDKIFKFHNCGAVGLNQITVQPNGDVCICQGDSKSSETKVGNIITDSISEILNNPNNEQWLKMFTVGRKECQYCEAISICGGGCPLQAEALFGKRTDLDKATCIYYKKSLKWLLVKYYFASIDGTTIFENGEEVKNVNS